MLKKEARTRRRRYRNPQFENFPDQPISKSLASEFEVIANSLKSGDAANSQLSISALAERIAQEFRVKGDAVAILAVSERWRHIYFLVPRRCATSDKSRSPALRRLRLVPCAAPADIVNNFSSVRHASVFAGVKAASLNTSAIQKIISAPILADGKVIGVIQISRKAATLREAGADFTSDDLGKILAICKPLGKLMQPVAKE